MLVCWCCVCAGAVGVCVMQLLELLVCVDGAAIGVCAA
jgi:hypothetical protein